MPSRNFSIPNIICELKQRELLTYSPSLFAKNLSKNGMSMLITTKIESLLVDRRIAENLQIFGLNQSDCPWLITKLHQLQRSIYTLDCYGESTWEIQSHVLEKIWDSIYGQLRLFGHDYREARRLTSDIRAYQQIEIQLRDEKLPTEIPIQDFYYLKTCDVRLSRTVIAKITQNPFASVMSEMWDFYDLASEVCDDLTDIYEDSFDFNCNRFMIQREVLGDSETLAEYSGFLDKIEKGTQEIFKKSEKTGLLEEQQVCRWAFQRVAEARSLLNPLRWARVQNSVSPHSAAFSEIPLSPCSGTAPLPPVLPASACVPTQMCALRNTFVKTTLPVI